MKKSFLFAALVVCGFLQINAQDFSLGAKVGVNFASVGGDNKKNHEMVTSIHGGLVGEFMLTDQFGLQSEILYSGQGSSYEYGFLEENNGDIILETGEGTLKLDYIIMPLLAKYYLMEGLYLNAGPQVGILVSAKLEAGTAENNVKDQYSNVDFGLSFGAGYKLDMGLFFDARYYLGLSNINKKMDDPLGAGSNYEAPKNQNGVFQASVGFMF